MVEQNINIVGIPILYNILAEIKDYLSFKITNFNKCDDFLNFIKEKKVEDKNFFIITNTNNKNYFLNKKYDLKNIFFLVKQDSNSNSDHDYNELNYPIDIQNLIEKINIQLIKHKYSFQSKIKVKNYYLDLNSRTISKNKNDLKLTEREMEIILFLNDSKKPQKINDLQNKVWSYSSELETHTVETHIYRLRKKIKECFKDIDFIISTDNGYFIE
tara:strand:- start:2314 stop:2958 length:645 start_codon:yes stop_codon:yes gene_type:complete